MKLDFVNVSCKYESNYAIEDFTFSLKEKEIVGLIGSNGSGKTTTLLSMIKYLVPAKGKILLDGTDIFGIADDTYKISYISDVPVYYEELTLIEHLHFIKALCPENQLSIEEMVDKYDLKPHLQKTPYSLSKGTKQKLMIVMALLRNYDFLFADEPFNGLDPIQIRTLKSQLIQCKHDGKAILISSHLLDIMNDICDKYIFIHNGKLLGYGTQEEIIQNHGLELSLSLEEIYFSFLKRLAP